MLPTMLNDLRHDLRYGWRTMAKSPAVTLLAVLTLALGIGANTALFSVVHNVLLRPLPYADSDRLVMVWPFWKNFGRGSISIPQYFDARERIEAFDSVAIYNTRGVNFSVGAGDPEHVATANVTSTLFPLLGARPQLGRTFTPEEDYAAGDRSVILSDGLWRRRFAGSSGILGTKVDIHGAPYTVVGVMPPDFDFPEAGVDLWMPHRFTPADLQERGRHDFRLLARLRPGVAFDAASSQVTSLARQLQQDFAGNYPSGDGWTLNLVGLQDHIVGSVRPALLVLQAAVAFVLLIACANIANLLLARATSREKEFAVRAALGAGRGRLVRQTLTESIMLAVAGGALGVVVAAWALAGITTLAPNLLPRVADIELNTAALAFTLGISLFTGVLFGLVPAFEAAGHGSAKSLKEGGRTTVGGARRRVRSLLVVSEVALAVMLLVGAGLMVRSFMALEGVDPGFQPDRVLSTRVVLTSDRYSIEQSREFLRQLTERLEKIPGVDTAAAANTIPFSGFSTDRFLEIEGYQGRSDEIRPNAQYRVITPGFFRTLGIPLLRGRGFTEDDRSGTQLVAIVSEAVARKYWGERDPVGGRLSLGVENEWYEVVGVAADIRHRDLAEDPLPTLYLPYTQQGRQLGMNILVRAAATPGGILRAVRGAVRDLDASLPLFEVRTLPEVMAASVARPRFQFQLMSAFALLALLLAVVGIYGVLSYSVTQRTREIGVRVALGAQPGDIIRLVAGEGLRLAIIGVAAGLAGAALLTRFLATELYGVSATDPLTFLLMPAALLGVAVLACWLPARRAARVEPMVALRYE